MSEQERTRTGAPITRWFAPIDRYFFDFERCTASEGWKQYDTDQDASYFGVWVHREKKVIVTYAEGDVSEVRCENAEQFRDELKAMADCYGPPPPSCVGYDMDGTRTEYYDTDAAFGREIPGLEVTA